MESGLQGGRKGRDEPPSPGQDPGVHVKKGGKGLEVFILSWCVMADLHFRTVIDWLLDGNDGEARGEAGDQAELWSTRCTTLSKSIFPAPWRPHLWYEGITIKDLIRWCHRRAQHAASGSFYNDNERTLNFPDSHP